MAPMLIRYSLLESGDLGGAPRSPSGPPSPGPSTDTVRVTKASAPDANKVAVALACPPWKSSLAMVAVACPGRPVQGTSKKPVSKLSSSSMPLLGCEPAQPRRPCRRLTGTLR